jgi:hypothetical protein
MEKYFHTTVGLSLQTNSIISVVPITTIVSKAYAKCVVTSQDYYHELIDLFFW